MAASIPRWKPSHPARKAERRNNRQQKWVTTQDSIIRDCERLAQRMEHMGVDKRTQVKDKNLPKNTKEKKNDRKEWSQQIYAARADEETEESEPYEGSPNSWKAKEWDSRMNSKRWPSTSAQYRTRIQEDFKEIENRMKTTNNRKKAWWWRHHREARSDRGIVESDDPTYKNSQTRE